ncbi:uncharacterized protein LOC119431634 [Dermacentor silvarum]|uniref:uncharacterized protein LOC119431634 n=1 Tax=Dermacentor silvarum TaxID=543639 RepID=UPI00210149F6|nr:uncharacterized protein LOC119431634 [Dermacentor silvarum]
MATTPGVEAVDPEEAPQGPSDNRSGDTAASYCSTDSGRARSCEPGENDGTSRSCSDAGDVVSKAASTSYSSPSVSAGRGSAMDVAGASGSSVGSCENGGTGDNATGAGASCATEVAAVGGGTKTGGAGSSDTGNADVGGAAAYGNGSAEDVAGASCECGAGSVERCVSKDGGTGEADAGVGASSPTRVVRVDGTGGGGTETEATRSSTTGNAEIGSVTSDQAAATGAGGGNGIARRTGATRVEPAAVPSSVHYGIYVNNIPLDVEEDQLRALFEPYGEVLRLKLVKRPEYTTFVFAYVLLDSDDNTKRAIQELDGTVLNGQPLKMEPTFGRTTHIFGIGEGTPYNRSRAALEQWRQKRDAQQGNGNRGRQPRNDDHWRRGYNDRSNYGDRRFGDRNYGDHRYGDRFNNNDRRYGGGNRFDNGSGNRFSGGNDRYGGYRHNNNNNQGRYNNRYDNDGYRGFSRYQRNGFQGDGGRYQRDGFRRDGGGGGHWQHGYRSSGGPNQAGYRSSDDGQRHQYGRYQDRYGDFAGRRGGGCNDGGCGLGGNHGGDDDGFASNYERCLEAMRKMRDAWTRRLERLAAEGDDGEEWPTFDELLELVRHTPYNIPMRADDVDDENEEDAGQPVFWWAHNSITGGGGDDFGPQQAPRTVLELLRWRHGEDAVAQVFSNADGEESEEDGGVCLIVDGGADGEQGPRSPPHEDSSSAVPEELDSGYRDVVGAAVDVAGEGVAESSKRDEEARLTQSDWPLSIQQHVSEERQPRAGDDSESKLAEGEKAGEMSVSCEEENIEHSAATSTSEERDAEGGKRDEDAGLTQGDSVEHAGEERQPRGGDDSESKLAEGKKAGEMSVSCEEENNEHSAATSSQGSVAGDGDVSENTSVGSLSTASSGEIFDSGDVSANDYSEGSAENDTLQSELASGRSLSLPRHLSRFIENVEDNDAGGQAQGQQPSRTASMDMEDVTEEAFENTIAEAASADPLSQFADAEEDPFEVVPEAKSANSERNLSVAAKLLCAVETLQNDSGGYRGRRQRREGSAATTTIAERMAAASSWNRAQRAATVRAGANDNEDDKTEDDESEFTSEDESFCTEIIVRMKNARNAVHLAARQGGAATESKFVPATEAQGLPTEPPAAKVISELLMENESGNSVVLNSSGFDIGHSSESIGARQAPALIDLTNMAESGEEASNADKTERDVTDEMRAPSLVETEGAGGASNMAAGGVGGGAKPKGTRPFQHAKRRQRRNVAVSALRCVPGQTSRSTARDAFDGGHESDALTPRKEGQHKGGAVDAAVQDPRAREGGVRRALRRKADFEDDSETDDELSDSEVENRLRRATHWARVPERNSPDVGEVDPPADVEDATLSEGGRSGEAAATPMQLIKHSAEDGGASKGTGGPTGREPKCGLEGSSAGTAQGGGDAVLEANGRGGLEEDDPETKLTSGGFEEGTQDGVGGAQQTTTAEQGAAQSSRAGGDSSETGRRDAVDTRRPSRPSRRGEEIECEPSDGQ